MGPIPGRKVSERLRYIDSAEKHAFGRLRAAVQLYVGRWAQEIAPAVREAT